MSSTSIPETMLTDAVVFGDANLQTGGEILGLCFAEDGTLWSVEEQGIVRAWNPHKGQPLTTHSLSDLETLWRFSPNAQLLASASDDLSIWEPKTGNLLTVIPQESWITAVAFHPKNAIVVTGHDDGNVRVWDVPTQNLLHELPGQHPISAVAFAHDSDRLASASESKSIVIWDTTTGTMLGECVGHKDRIPSLAWHPGGKRLVSAGWDTTARIWDAQTFQPVILLNSHATQVWTLAFSRDGEWLACADSNNSIHIWKFVDHKTVQVLHEGSTEFRHLAFSPDGKILASAGQGAIRLWDTVQGKSLSRSLNATTNSVSINLHPDGNSLVTTSAMGVQVWDNDAAQVKATLDDPQTVHCVVYHPDGQTIIGGTDEYLRVWDANTGTASDMMEGPKEPITSLALSADGRYLASGSQFGMPVWLWDMETRAPLLLIPDPLQGCTVEALAFHPDGGTLAVGGIDRFGGAESTGAVSLWNIQERCEIATFIGGTTCVAYHPDGTQLATGTVDESICIWNTATNELITEIAAHEDAICALAYSPDGKYLVSSSDDWTLRIWDTGTWTLRAARELTTAIKALTFSANGTLLFTGNGNATFYRLQTAKLLA